MEQQVGQMATAINYLESQVSGKLPSQPEINPKQNVNAVTLRSGKELKDPPPSVSKRDIEEEIEKDAPNELEEKQPCEQKPAIREYKINSHFPSRFAKSKKEEQEKEIMETFRKVEVNIPLLDAIKQILGMQNSLKSFALQSENLRELRKCMCERMFRQ